MKNINEIMYSHVWVIIPSLWNRFLHEFVGLTPAINLKNLFCKLNIFWLLDDLPEKVLHTSMYRENIQNKLIW
jgi:hypothetical protein